MDFNESDYEEILNTKKGDVFLNITNYVYVSQKCADLLGNPGRIKFYISKDNKSFYVKASQDNSGVVLRKIRPDSKSYYCRKGNLLNVIPSMRNKKIPGTFIAEHNVVLFEVPEK